MLLPASAPAQDWTSGYFNAWAGTRGCFYASSADAEASTATSATCKYAEDVQQTTLWTAVMRKTTFTGDWSVCRGQRVPAPGRGRVAGGVLGTRRWNSTRDRLILASNPHACLYNMSLQRRCCRRYQLVNLGSAARLCFDSSDSKPPALLYVAHWCARINQYRASRTLSHGGARAFVTATSCACAQRHPLLPGPARRQDAQLREPGCVGPKHQQPGVCGRRLRAAGRTHGGAGSRWPCSRSPLKTHAVHPAKCCTPGVAAHPHRQ